MPSSCPKYTPAVHRAFSSHHSSHSAEYARKHALELTAAILSVGTTSGESWFLIDEFPTLKTPSIQHYTYLGKTAQAVHPCRCPASPMAHQCCLCTARTFFPAGLRPIASGGLLLCCSQDSITCTRVQGSRSGLVLTASLSVHCCRSPCAIQTAPNLMTSDAKGSQRKSNYGALQLGASELARRATILLAEGLQLRANPSHSRLVLTASLSVSCCRSPCAIQAAPILPTSAAKDSQRKSNYGCHAAWCK